MGLALDLEFHSVPQVVGLKGHAALMSALGQKQTCAAQEGMSALPPKADIASYFLGVIGVERATWSSIARSKLMRLSNNAKS